MIDPVLEPGEVDLLLSAPAIGPGPDDVDTGLGPSLESDIGAQSAEVVMNREGNRVEPGA